MGSVALLAALLVPLSVDTFVLGAALGIAGAQGSDRLRIGLVLAAFEAGMPIVGFLLGGGLGRVLGGVAGYTGIAALALTGVLLLREGDADDEARRLRLLARARGVAVVDLGLSISVDELALGVSAGLLGLSPVATVAWLAVQGFAAAQLGLWLGGWVGGAFREAAERLAGAALVATALVLLVLRLLGR